MQTYYQINYFNDKLDLMCQNIAFKNCPNQI